MATHSDQMAVVGIVPATWPVTKSCRRFCLGVSLVYGVRFYGSMPDLSILAAASETDVGTLVR